MYCCKLTIPRMSHTYKLYVYRSKSAESINTISKVKELQPIMIIDEAVCKSHVIDCNGQKRDCYEIYDHDTKTQDGVQYIGPKPNIIPVSLYETKVNIVKLNDYTYVNALEFDEINNNHYDGTMLYYSVIGVDESSNLITHLSKVYGIIVKSEFKKGVRHLYECNDYKNDNTDEWKYVSSVDWSEGLIIGDVTDTAAIARFGIPFVEEVPIFDSDKLQASIKPVSVNNFMVLEIPNPWQRNNKEYNFRKLKSYKLCNVEDEQYGEYSEPTFQSLLPVSIEKMLILRKTDEKHPEWVIKPSEIDDTDNVDSYQIIRKNGIYYDAKEHRKLGLNKFNIPLEEKVAVFNEASVQEKIKIQTVALPAHIYSYSVYLIDVYGNISKPAHFVVRT